MLEHPFPARPVESSLPHGIAPPPRPTQPKQLTRTYTPSYYRCLRHQDVTPEAS